MTGHLAESVYSLGKDVGVNQSARSEICIGSRKARFQRVQRQCNTLGGEQRGRQPGLEVQFCLEAARPI
ncbi:hypothetical protein GALMADRAFT_575624 [Galerina marginata CBS 339.88]|uniref:Uncharacterized protein n=1 Tax=Galerina marginata (strain CBS 339.88) TaxID=685588 RepID=A0A067STN2_GALM3|nr:hypothetical protein GALMADRAFT_575624 [Galerina marginata CBS 339.88]